MNIKLTKLYKCNVTNCHNSVHIKGVFCKSCLNKILNYSYDLLVCQFCNNLIEIRKRNTAEKDLKKRIVTVICGSCVDFFGLDFEEEDNACE